MTYVHTMNAGDYGIFERLHNELDPHCHGLIARYAGTNEHGLAVTSIWQTKADSDRFTTEHLIPALRTVLGDITTPAGADARNVAFEVADEYHQRARS